MTTVGLIHINLRAHREHLDKLKDFYCEVAGLQHRARPPIRGFGYWLYTDDRAIVHVYEAEPDEERRAHIATTIDHFAFDCTNRAGVEEALKRRGVDYRSMVAPATRQVPLFIGDPAGSSVELNFAGHDS